MSAPTSPTPEHPDAGGVTVAEPQQSTEPYPNHQQPYQPAQPYQPGPAGFGPVSAKLKNAIIAGGIGLAVGFGLLGFGAGYVVGHENSSGSQNSWQRGPGMNGGPRMNGGPGMDGQLPGGSNGQMPQMPGMGQNGQTPNGQNPQAPTQNPQAPTQTQQAPTQTS
ncbi:hypothetical protein [Gordonia sp. NPDC003429]